MYKDVTIPLPVFLFFFQITMWPGDMSCLVRSDYESHLGENFKRKKVLSQIEKSIRVNISFIVVNKEKNRLAGGLEEEVEYFPPCYPNDS